MFEHLNDDGEVIVITEKKQSKSVRILDMIEASPNGMRFSEIQEALFHMSNPGKLFTKRDRGYWCTNLGPMTGGSTMHSLLGKFCKKGTYGLWHRNSRLHNGKPWSTKT